MNYENYRPTGYRLLPPVIKNIIIINVIFYLATLVLAQRGIDLIDILGLHYFSSEKFRLYQVITYMFMHDSSSIMHILLNMFMLWMFGSIVENTWGGKKFLNFYIITGLGAAVAHYAIVYFQLNPEISFFNRYINAGSPEEMKNLLNNEAINYRYGSEFFEFVRNNNLSATESISYATQFVSQLLNGPVLIGASGAVYGILLAYGMLFPNSLIYIYFMLPLKAKYMVVIYALIELFSGIAGQGNVAHFAHLGGLVTGFILIMYWRNKNRRNNNDFYNPY